MVMLYTSRHLELHIAERGGDILLVTFNEMGMRADGHRFWGDQLAERLGLSAAGFVSREPNWFPQVDMRLAIAALLARVGEQFHRHICCGLGQGGHAALVHARALRADAVIAFSPQASINPREVTDERFNRFFNPDLHGSMLPADDEYPAARYVFYDPHDTLDATHVALLRERLPLVEFALPFIGHSSAVPFLHAETLQALLAGTLQEDTAAMMRVAAAARRRSPSRAYSICHALHDRRPAATLRILRKYRDIHPRNSWWLIGRLLAFQGLGWSVFGWMMELCVERPRDAEIQACTAMVAIELGDRTAARRFADAAVAIEPGNPTWQWVVAKASALD